jgi:C-22 sterol desaturase
MASVYRSFVSPTADAAASPLSFAPRGIVANLLNDLTVWKALFMLAVAAVIYDQLRYFWLKGSIVGPSWKMPFMGPFLQSVNPKFHEYKAKWDSGELSCVSVFHK